jgi:hypothetical protein
LKKQDNKFQSPNQEKASKDLKLDMQKVIEANQERFQSSRNVFVPQSGTFKNNSNQKPNIHRHETNSESNYNLFNISHREKTTTLNLGALGKQNNMMGLKRMLSNYQPKADTKKKDNSDALSHCEGRYKRLLTSTDVQSNHCHTDAGDTSSRDDCSQTSVKANNEETHRSSNSKM